jgi:hypothetical protein
MSNYTKATNFATKDTLPTGDANKIVKGTEIDNEFNSISGAISSKADLASPTFTGTPAAPTATAGSNTTQVANTTFVTAAITALSLGNMSTQAKTAVEITGGTINGVTGTNSGMTVGTATNANNATTVTNGVYTTNFSGSNQSLGTNGYQKLPQGLILQWGTTSVVSPGSAATITFPIAFPNSLGSIQLTASDPSPNNAISAPQISAQTTTSFSFQNKDPDSSYSCYWFAVGW